MKACHFSVHWGLLSCMLICGPIAIGAGVSYNFYPTSIAAHGSGTEVGTPFAVHVTLAGDASSVYEYRVYVTYSWSSARVWNAAQSRWVHVGTSWGNNGLPQVTTDGSGVWSGWLHAYVYAGVGTRSTTLRVRFRKLNTSTDLDADAGVNTLDMSTSGAWIEATAVASTAGLAVLAFDASDNIIGAYAVEDNGIDEGYSGTAGYFKMAVPANTAIRKLEVLDASGSTVATQTSMLWSSGAPGTTTDLDDQYDVSLPVTLTSFGAAVVPQGVELTWITESEVNSRGFYVLRSQGEALPYLAISPLIPGAGNSVQPRQYRYVDRTVVPEQTYWYKLRQEDLNGQVELFGPVTVFVPASSGGEPVAVPRRTALLGGYPNPFNPGTVVRFALAGEQEVEVLVFDLHGRALRTLLRGALPAGEHSARWDGRDDAGVEVPAGVYLCVLRCGEGFREGVKLVKLR